ncbi:UDP-N-acetylglucosamine--LPS N-acetylglucosamine transferase [Candidatus Woesearchaeota archaeon]|nr:UDP-N-acetylglucosamine--LPS N-acetylglucosamine transferase [Candidatus Woesearchaeota archaeon]
MTKKKMLVVLGMGGHTAQILRLLDSLGDTYEYEYVIGHDDTTSAAKIKLKGKIHVMRNPRLMTDKSIAKVALNMVPSTIDAFSILRKTKPDAILSAGPALTIPLFWLAKARGTKTIFVESWVRVHHQSLTGRLVYPVSDLFFVQWESMTKTYPKAIYAGRLS